MLQSCAIISKSYLDAMLSNDMVENNTSRIEFPDKDPDEWKIVYGYMTRDTDIDDENAQMCNYNCVHKMCIFVYHRCRP